MKREYKLILVAGARPNFMKIAPIIRSLKLKEKGIENTKVGSQRLVSSFQYVMCADGSK